MKQTTFAAISALLCSILLLSACSLGFEPAWKAKDGKASISLQFKTIEAAVSDSSGRAIVQGGGYLYLRTFDGPTGEKGPFYGPYPLGADNAIEILDIPAGTYSHIAFVYSAQKFEEMLFMYKVNPTETFTFQTMMLMPYEALLPLFTNAPGGPEPAVSNSMEDGTVSLHMSGETIIKEGTTNKLSVTLVPTAGNVFDLTLMQSYEISPNVAGSYVRKFVKLVNVGMGMPVGSVKNLICRIPAPSEAMVKTVLLYSEGGTSIPTSLTLVDGEKIFSAPYQGDTNYLLYIEYQALSLADSVMMDFSLEMNAVVTPTNVLNVSFEGGDSSYFNKKFFFGVYDSTIITMDGPPSGPPKAYGIIGIDGMGNGTASTALIPGTNLPYELNPGATYYITGFADIGNRYDTVTVANMGTVIDGVHPNYGDFSGKGTVTAGDPGPTSFTFMPGDLFPVTDFNYYVSQTGIGLGTSSADTCTLDVALDDIAINGPGRRNQIILMGNVTQTVSAAITSEVEISSPDASRYVIAFTTDTSAVPAYTVGNAGRLSMRNVVADAAGRTGATSSLIEVTGGGIFYLQKDALINNAKNTSSINYGGAVYLSGETPNPASFQLYGGTITNCSAFNGGAVYIGFASNMKIEMGSTITINTASGEGGGVYIAAQGILHDPSNTAVLMITGNTDSDNVDPDITLSGGTIDISRMMFVSNSGGGDGLTPETPCTYAIAYGSANVTGIVLVEDITLTAGVTIDKPFNIRSMDLYQYNIFLGETITTALFTVAGSSSLQLYGVTVGPAVKDQYTAASLVEVLANCNFTLQSGTKLTNNTTAGNGGAVYVRSTGSMNIGESFIMGGTYYESTITNCTAALGGGIYVEGGGVLTMDTTYASYMITANTATATGGNGGGIYMEMGSTLNESTTDDWTLNNRITGNTAEGTFKDLFRAN